MTARWTELRKRSPVLRKGWDFVRQVPRFAVRGASSHDEFRTRPPILANSFPKSGTHQLLQVASAFPGAVHWGSFLASTPSLTMRLRSSASHIRRIKAMVPGEYMGAHLYFSEFHAAALADVNAVHFFIYRDLRDVAVSELFYLRDMNRWHRLHRHFNRHCRSDDERLSLAILGLPGGRLEYPDIGERMRRYCAWIGRQDVFALKYEELNSPEREGVIRRMISFYAERAGNDFDSDIVLRHAINSLDPSRSHTFRTGGTGKWKEHFSPLHVEQFEAVAGSLNRELGYA